MLTTLSIRDVVLIERLDLTFEPGLTVLTGETGAGKSIVLDSLGLALGGRAETGLVRQGAAQAGVVASFLLPAGHPALALLAEQGIEADGAEIVLRRILGADGRSRAFVDDQPVSAALLRRLGATLVETQGQHEQMGLADPAGHAALLDAFGVRPASLERVRAAWLAWRETERALAAAREAATAAERDEAWLRHAVDELAALAPGEDEEEHLAAERQALQQGERRAEAIENALSELAPRDRRSPGATASLRAAARLLQRVVPTGDASHPAAAALAAIERAEEAIAEAESVLARLAQDREADPRRLEQAEERLFALRAAARKHGVAVVELPGLRADLEARLASIESGAAALAALQTTARDQRQAYREAAHILSAARRGAGETLTRAVGRELPPLRLDKARFAVEVTALDEPAWSGSGADRVRFLIATNPGQEPGPLAKVMSGGELSRLMLALKVVLSGGSPAGTLVFDEVDSGIGGATAAAVGERLARVAERVQVLVVTHSPQVAARGAAHLRVAKTARGGRAATQVDRLEPRVRREEIARMLAGETVTEAARAAADDLLGALA